MWKHPGSNRRAAMVVAFLSILATAPAAAQEPVPAIAAPTPEALAALVLDRLVSGSPEAYAEVVPFESALKAQAASWEVPIEVDPPVVLRRYPAVPGEGAPDRALLLLGAWPAVGNRGDETVVGRTFSGLYLARRDPDGWRLTDAFPPDAGNRILAHRLAVTLDPSFGLVVVDTMKVAVEGSHGFGAHLNRSAEITSATVDGRPAEHAFAGGYLWVDAPSMDSAALVLAYRLPVAADTLGGANSGRFAPDVGHVRNQYFWHPFYDFGSGRDRASFRITVRAPAAVRVITDLPQTETVVGDERIVRAASTRPTFASTLIYDADLETTTARIGELTAALYMTRDADPSADSVMATIRRVHRVLADRFGPPRSRHVVVAQTRLRGGGGWQFRSNDLIAAGARPGRVSRGGPYPRAWLGHEVAHGWTAPTGPATNFLSEGWATYAESILIGDQYGSRAEADSWESQRTYYERGGFDGRARLSSDPSNSGVSYSKGAWVLRMLRDRIGGEAFRVGMAAYMASPTGQPAGLEAFTSAVEAAVRRNPASAGHDDATSGPRDGGFRPALPDVRAFLQPWVEESVVPDLAARVEAGRVIVEQRQDPLFDLDVELDLVTAPDTVRRTLRLQGRADTLRVSGAGEVRDVLLDPDHRLLIRRHRGETVRLTVRAPGADSVALGATFLDTPLPASSSGDGTWAIELPLTAGVYGYWWRVDGRYVEPEGGERLVVRPANQLGDEALP